MTGHDEVTLTESKLYRKLIHRQYQSDLDGCIETNNQLCLARSHTHQAGATSRWRFLDNPQFRDFSVLSTLVRVVVVVSDFFHANSIVRSTQLFIEHRMGSDNRLPFYSTTTGRMYG